MNTLLSESFFEKGAFLTDPMTDDVVLAYGGLVEKSKTIDKSRPAFYLKDFFQDHFIAYYPEHWLKLPRKELLNKLEGIDPEIQVLETRNFDELYKKDFLQLKESWGPELHKVVLTSREEYKFHSKECITKVLFKKALNFGAGMPYGIWFEDYGVIGATPETLFETKGNVLKTMALAGTIQKGSEHELLHSPKDRKEHELVVQDISEKLSPFCEEVQVASTGLESFKEMVHLRTDISAQLKNDADLGALTCALSPTAALGGYPMRGALDFLKKTRFAQKWSERYFGSAFGVCQGSDTHFVVSIRNVQWQNDLIIIESGGGVLPESVLDKELAEIRLKRDSIRKHYL